LRRHAGDCKGASNVESDGVSLSHMDQLVYADNYPELAASPQLKGVVCLCCKVFVGVDQVYRHFETPEHANKSKPAIGSLLAKFKDGELIKDSSQLHRFLLSQPLEPALPFLDPAVRNYWCEKCQLGYTTEKGCLVHIEKVHTDETFSVAVEAHMKHILLQRLALKTIHCIENVFQL
jgi:hypothetical protein